VAGPVAFVAAALRPESGGGASMTVVEGILLAVSVAVFIYLGVAMFKPEWF
jgi:K+-transporting ATPase KdpF subunit